MNILGEPDLIAYFITCSSYKNIQYTLTHLVTCNISNIPQSLTHIAIISV